MEIEGAVALVTGAGSGLGAATTTYLDAKGATVVAIDRDDRALEELAASLPDVTVVEADITRADDVARAVAVADAAGALRIVVNCAGGGTAPGRTVARSGRTPPLQPWREVIELNLVAAYDVTRQAAEAMARLPELDGGRGVVVHTSSIAALDGSLGMTSYVASKGGLAAFVGSAARDLAVWGIRVVGVAPGAFDTPGYSRLPRDIRERRADGFVYPRRPGRPGEFAAFVAHMIENDYVNAECYRLDAGLRIPE